MSYQLPVLQKVTTYVAEPLLRDFENSQELLLYLNKTVTNATPSKIKGHAKLFLLLRK